MRFTIKHEIKGRLRIHIIQNKMSCEQADILLYYIQNLKNVTYSKVYENTMDAIIGYVGTKADIIQELIKFRYDSVNVPTDVIENSGRKLNGKYKEKLIHKVIQRYLGKLFLPLPIRTAIIGIKSAKYIYHGIKILARGKIEVPVLDALAIGVSIFRNDMNSAGSVMFLLGIGEILEEWTHKKAVNDLAYAMSLHESKVWLIKEDQQILVPSSEVQKGDLIIVRMGSVIPFDGIAVNGEAMINQSSLTGESVPVRKIPDSFVYAGTVVEEGELTISIKEIGGSSKYDKIVTMIEESEKLKSVSESRAEHLADKLVPYTLAGTILTYLLTKSTTKALSVLMVDFSCALKLSMPIAVLSAIKEASLYNITVKGGKYLELVAEADTIVFDKTGTLTKAVPTVAEVIPFNGKDSDDLLRIAACIEEHFPHSMARAVVDAAKARKLEHEEMHSKVEYIVAHGISTTIQHQKTILGSYHFVFEDEKCSTPPGMEAAFNALPAEYSHLYLAIDTSLAAVICIEDPVREETDVIMTSLKKAGIKKVVMMTGDSEKTARSISKKIGVDEYYSEVLPQDKANYIMKEKQAGKKVIMVGDGINDSPALSAADVGIAISSGAEIAREIADITISADSLFELLTLKCISNSLMKRISHNYNFIIGFNSLLLLLGIIGILPPTTSALLHNMSTLGISVKSMGNLLT